MIVRIMVDDLRLHEADGVEDVLSAEVNAVHAVRERIRARLRNLDSRPLVLRMSSGIFRRFADLEGQPGLVVERVSPRRMLRARLGCPLPSWLGDDLVLVLGALSHDDCRASGADQVEQVLSLIDLAQAQAPDIASMLTALSHQSAEMMELLAVSEVRQRLKERFETAGIAAATELLALFIDGPSTPREAYRVLSLAAVRECLDDLIVRDGLSPEFALPPRLCSKTLAQKFPALPLAEADAAPYPDYLRRLLVAAERKVHGGELSVQSLADYALQCWPGLLERFQTLFEKFPGIASEPLIVALRNLGGEVANVLATKMHDYLNYSHCDPLPADACVNDVLRWSERYFRYAIGTFERHAEPDEAIGESFARWVAGQQNRIIQSEYDWRTVARMVDEELAAGNLVILCMIDALGAIHMDLLELELRQRLVDQAAPIMKPLFAPLPTITEAGKIGVLTGQDRQTSSADYEKAIRERFPDHLMTSGALQIVRSWRDFRQALSSETRLLVCLDNRVDDDLHQCTEFRLHRERVRAVAAHLAELIANWLLDAARFGAKATILITADHGATKVSRSCEPLPGSEPIERRLLQVSAAPDPVPEGFSYTPANGRAGGWLIPYGRLAFGSTMNLLHGGLTPEEVLIPFIRIAPSAIQVTFALRLTAAEARCHTATKGWYAHLSLTNSSNETFFNLKAVAKHPFAGQSQSIGRLNPFETQTPIILNLTATIEQQGKTRVPFELRYQAAAGAAFQVLFFEMDLELGAHLLERTVAAREFNDFFDL